VGLCFYAAVCADKDAAGQRRQLRLQLNFMKLGFLSHSPATIQPPQLACRSSQPSPCAADGGLSSTLVGGRVLGFWAADFWDTAGRTAASAGVTTAGLSSPSVNGLLAPDAVGTFPPRGSMVRGSLARSSAALDRLSSAEFTPPVPPTVKSLHTLQLAPQNWCMNCGFDRHWCSAAHSEHAGLRSTHCATMDA